VVTDQTGPPDHGPRHRLLEQAGALSFGFQRLEDADEVSTFGVMAPGIFAVMAPPKSTEIRGSNGPQA